MSFDDKPRAYSRLDGRNYSDPDTDVSGHTVSVTSYIYEYEHSERAAEQRGSI